MKMDWLLWALLASVFWGLGPVFAKLGLVKSDPFSALVLRTAGVGIGLFVWGSAGAAYGFKGAGPTHVYPSILRGPCGIRNRAFRVLQRSSCRQGLIGGPRNRFISSCGHAPRCSTLGGESLAEPVDRGGAGGCRDLSHTTFSLKGSLTRRLHRLPGLLGSLPDRCHVRRPEGA